MKRSMPHQRLRRRRRHRQKRASSMSFLPILMTILWTILCLTIPLAMVKAQEQSTSSPVVGIDLGTTYSCVGIFQNGKVEIIPNEQGNRITPSYVAFSENSQDRMVGDAAKNQATVNPTNTVFDVKRLIGRNFSDKSVQADRKLVPFEILSKDNKPVVQVNANGSKSTYTPEEISAMILSNMKTTAEQFLGEPVTRAVITVPAYFNNAQRQATADAATIAGLKVERIINEPTAAAMAYGIDKTMDDSNVLVFDLGGGTFDVTLLNIDGGVFDVMATSGDTHLGGEDFDQRVMQYFIKKIQKTHGTDISNEKIAIQKLRKEVERVKRALSTQTQARIEIDDLVPGLTFTDTLTRARFEELNNDLFKKTLTPIETVLKDAKLDKSDVEHIVLVGGSTRIPRIQELVSEFFGGKELSKGINPDEAVANGASIMGGILGGVANKKLDPIVLLDVASLSQGIETVGGVMTKMIQRGTQIPTRKTQVFSTNQDNQSSVTIQVYEGERSMTKDNHLLGQFQLSGIPPAPRGVPQIEVSFQIDANGILQVSAVDKATGKSEKVTITSEQGRLSQDEIDRMIEAAKEHEEEDRLVKERIDARNGLESYLYNTRNTMEATNNISFEDKKELLDLVDEALDWMADNLESDKESYVEKLKEMEQIANPIIRKAYDSSSGGADNMDDYADEEL